MSHDVDARPINVSLTFFQVSPLDHSMCPNVSLILNGQSVHSVRRDAERVPNVSLIMVPINAHVRHGITTECDGIFERVPNVSLCVPDTVKSTCPVSPLRRRGDTRTRMTVKIISMEGRS